MDKDQLTFFKGSIEVYRTIACMDEPRSSWAQKHDVFNLLQILTPFSFDIARGKNIVYKTKEIETNAGSRVA